MHSTNIPSECEDCVAECDVETCGLARESSQCTDRCLVVPCEDRCPDVCDTACVSWPDPRCETAIGFEGLPDCCLDLHPQGHHQFTSLPDHLLLRHEGHDGTQHLDWTSMSLSRELDALICACSTQSQPHSFNYNSCDPRLLSVDKPHLHPNHDHPSFSRSLSERMSGSDSPTSALLSPMLSASASVRSSPDPSSASASDTQSSQQIGQESGSHMNIQTFQPQPSENFFCLWAECGKLFRSSQDLISHVNATHLHLPISPRNFPQQLFSPQPSQFFTAPNYIESPAHQGPISVSCQWDNCNVYPTPSHIPGPSTGNAADAALGLLASHLLQDHLGVYIPHPPTPDPSRPSYIIHAEEGGPQDESTHILPDPFDVPAPARHPPPTTFPPPPLASPLLTEFTHATVQHFCKWKSCTIAQTAFATSAELTAHITDMHVGSGRNRYDCQWEGCGRHGTTGFSSKQKILRHIQSHTGHRPFRCKVCDQLFSEAATLQQHMRRHTKEKPYACDFPGCNKAFAITGALTIHKRTHSGKKPFKCTYCDRSFSESSNLSKHIRTHTGDRPYGCSHPGCEKRFARPDQVTRHMGVHNKKKRNEGGARGSNESSEMKIEQ